MYPSGLAASSSHEHALAYDFGHAVDARVHISPSTLAQQPYHQAASGVPPSRTTRKGTIQAAYELFTSDSVHEPLDDVSASTLGIPPHLHLTSGLPSSPTAAAPGTRADATSSHQAPRWGLVSTPGPAPAKPTTSASQLYTDVHVKREQLSKPTPSPSWAQPSPPHPPARMTVADSLSEGQQDFRFRVSEDDMMMSDIMNLPGGAAAGSGGDLMMHDQLLLSGAALGAVLDQALPFIVESAARTLRSTSNSSNHLGGLPDDRPLLRLPSVAQWGLLEDMADSAGGAGDGGGEHDPAGYNTYTQMSDLMMKRGASGMGEVYDALMGETGGLPAHPRGLSLCKGEGGGEGGFTSITAPGSRGWRCSSSGGPSSGFPFMTPDSPSAGGHPHSNHHFLVAADEDGTPPGYHTHPAAPHRPRPGSRQAVGATVSSPHPSHPPSPNAPIAALSASLMGHSAGGHASAGTGDPTSTPWYPGTPGPQHQYVSSTSVRQHVASSPVSLAPHPARRVPALLTANSNRQQQPPSGVLPKGGQAMPEQHPRDFLPGPAPAAGVPPGGSQYRCDPLRYGAAVTSVLSKALGGDPALGFNMNLPVGGAKLGAPDASVTARGHDFSQALMAVLKDCLSQMGYSKRRAHAAAQGDMSDCTDIEIRVLKLLHEHMQALTSRYITSLTGPNYAPPNGAGGQRPGSSGGLRRTTAESCASPALPYPDLAGATRQPPPMAAQQYTAMAMGIDTSDRLVDRFRRQLKMYACHMWALMNILTPHPPREVKAGLGAYTERSSKQITDWFTNWRARHWKKIIAAIQASCGQEGEEGTAAPRPAGVKQAAGGAGTAEGRTSGHAKSRR